MSTRQKNVHFDEAKILAACARVASRYDVMKDNNDSNGAQARFALAVLQPFWLALAREANRGTPIDAIVVGVASTMSNMAHSLAHSVVGDALDDRVAVINRLMVAFGECLQLGFSGEIERVRPEQAGNA